MANAVQRVVFAQNSGVLTLTLDTSDTKLLFDEFVTVGIWIVLANIYTYMSILMVQVGITETLCSLV